MIDQLTHGFGVVFFLGLFGWVLWLVVRIRKLDEMAREIHSDEIKKEYDVKVKAFLDNDLNTRVKLSNERLGLRDSTKPKGDE